MKVTNSEYADYGPSEFTEFRPQQPEIITKANSRTWPSNTITNPTVHCTINRIIGRDYISKLTTCAYAVAVHLHE